MNFYFPLMSWYTKIINFLVICEMFLQWNTEDKNKFLVEVKKKYILMIVTYSNIVPVKFFGYVFPIIRKIVY